MIVLSFIKTICSSFFCYNFTNKNLKTSFSNQRETHFTDMKTSSCYAKQEEHFSTFSFEDESSNQYFKMRSVSYSASSIYPTVTPLASHLKDSKNLKTNQASCVQQTSEILLSQNLLSQIDQLENENKALAAELSMKYSDQTLFKSIYSLSKLESSENVRKHAELKKLNFRLQNISNFCNEEMIEVLNFVSESCNNLDKKLAALRKECASIDDNDLLYENIEHIDFLEKTVETLHQIETKFQSMQKMAFDKTQTMPSFQNPQERHINSLLEKIEKLNERKQFLIECKQQLPTHAAYHADELKNLMELFENESEDLAQKTKEARQKFNQAKQFGKELTNHLLDYAEVFKDYTQKLRQLSSPKLIQIKPIISTNCTLLSHATVQASLHVTQEDEEMDSNELRKAAINVAKALKELLQVTSQIDELNS